MGRLGGYLFLLFNDKRECHEIPQKVDQFAPSHEIHVPDFVGRSPPPGYASGKEKDFALPCTGTEKATATAASLNEIGSPTGTLADSDKYGALSREILYHTSRVLSIPLFSIYFAPICKIRPETSVMYIGVVYHHHLEAALCYERNESVSHTSSCTFYFCSPTTMTFIQMAACLTTIEQKCTLI